MPQESRMAIAFSSMPPSVAGAAARAPEAAIFFNFFLGVCGVRGFRRVSATVDTAQLER